MIVAKCEILGSQKLSPGGDRPAQPTHPSTQLLPIQVSQRHHEPGRLVAHRLRGPMGCLELRHNREGRALQRALLHKAACLPDLPEHQAFGQT
jgi:hypothetical protein